MSLKVRLLYMALLALTLGDAAYGAPEGSGSLADVLNRIRERKRSYDVLSLRARLDGIPPDREELPARDASSGAINILGETPRDKDVTQFVESVIAFRRAVETAQEAQDRTARDLQLRDGTLRQVSIEVASANSSDIWAPLRIEISVDGKEPTALSYLPPVGASSVVVPLARTALTVGRHSVRLQGVAAAVPGSGPLPLATLREPLGFELGGTIDVMPLRRFCS